MNVQILYQARNGAWNLIGILKPGEAVDFKNDDIAVKAVRSMVVNGIDAYEMCVDAQFPTRVKLCGEMEGDRPYHLIPCCIYGDNNFRSHHKADEYPILTDDMPEAVFTSPYWEFRADRAALPVSILFTEQKLGAISIDPYDRNTSHQLIRNGVFSELPNRFGVTLGYANLPGTFRNKRDFMPSTQQCVKKTRTSGYIFHFEGGAAAVKEVLAFLYAKYREIPTFQNSLKNAAQAIVDSFVEQNYSTEFGHYTNQKAYLPSSPNLEPWRGVYEIAWTGGVILGYPFMKAERLLHLPKNYFDKAKSGYVLFDEVADNINPETGMFFDLAHELNGSKINGWWTGLFVKDLHCAYTNGEATYYLFKQLNEMKSRGETIPLKWEKSALTAANTFLKLQREDGNCGYTFLTDRAEVADWDGFAGCWIGSAFAEAAVYTKDDKFLIAARKAADYYHRFIASFYACGSPMDTWKSPEQEGNLGFMRLARTLYQYTNDPKYLDMMEDSATYEYTWRYGFKAIPEIPPLQGSTWNSCGGSVTSVSNPHIHPMGLLITGDLYYLAEKTGNILHRKRADDGVAWAMNCLEMYPGTTGYGRYGVTTERYCPSDGLTIENYDDGRTSSMWFSYNAWAAGNMLEGLLSALEHENESTKQALSLSEIAKSSFR